MADPMWSGGAEQFQDRYPYVWFIMHPARQALFLPHDPPLDPSAFYDTVAPIMDFPVLGTAYSPFISDYVVYYNDCWLANPPATYSSVGEPPTLDDDTSISAKLDAILDRVERIEDNIGLYTEGQTVLADLAAIYARVSGGEETPPPIATTADTARILAALYYIAQSVIVPAWSIDNTEVLGAISDLSTELGADTVSLANNAEANKDTIVAAIGDVETAIGNIEVDTQPILDALEGLELGDGRYPGADLVDLGTPVNLTSDGSVTTAMQGCLLNITEVPPRVGTLGGAGITNYYHLGWLVFQTAEGDCDEVQFIGPDQRVYIPKQMAAAAKVTVICKTGTHFTVTPWNRKA